MSLTQTLLLLQHSSFIITLDIENVTVVGGVIDPQDSVNTCDMYVIVFFCLCVYTRKG